MSSGTKRWAVGLLVAAAIGAALVFWLRPGLLQPSMRRVIVVGLGGADWQLLDDYCADGTMPNLARMVREGRPGVLRTLSRRSRRSSGRR